MSESRKLRAYVHVVDEDNQPVVLKPGDEVPAWAAKQVTNPKAFADEDDATASDSAPAKRAPRKAAAKRPARGKAATRPDPAPPADQGSGDRSASNAGDAGDAGDAGGGSGSSE